MAESDRRIADAFRRESARLRGFIRRRVAAADDVEDVLQDVFSDLVEALRLPRPIEHLSAWLYEVTRRRIADRFRRTGRAALAGDADAEAARTAASGDEDPTSLEDLLPSADAGPEAAYARRLFIEAVDDALAELPAAQREVFIAHELDGKSFRQLAAERGIGINTLLSQKRYAVLHLRRRLEAIRAEFVFPETDHRS
ncbi:MAG TPA: sigma-70 family RNA polymerase sigma factor [Caldimonas sp.]|nr:sigma-70 family RNA polymerase sigma factor [Caldimonas sp.]